MTHWLPVLCFALAACSPELGSSRKPVRMHIVPSESQGEASAEALAKHLSRVSGLSWDVTVPDRYIDLVVAMREHRADVAFMNTTTYLLAHERVGAQAWLAVERGDHERSYAGMVITRGDSGITTLQDLNGKTIAYVDVYSLSGYLLPGRDLHRAGIKPASLVRAGTHEAVLELVRSGEVDAGFTFERPAGKLRVLLKTEKAPNEPVVFRKDLSEADRERIIKGLLDTLATEKGGQAFQAVHGITGLVRVTDAEYDGVREALEALGKRADETAPGGGLLDLAELRGDDPIPPLGD